MANNKYYKLLLDYDKHCQRIAAATTIRINEPPADKAERIRKLEKDYVKWFEYYFPNYAKYKCAWFHKKLANAIIKNKVVRALAAWFRSAAKSVHIDLGIPLYLYLALNDLHFMLLVGETDPKAKKLLSGIQAQLQYNKRIINDYGERFKFGDWADGDFSTTDGVRFQAIGFGMSPRGAREDAERPDYIVVDDVDNRKHVNNDRLMEDGVNYITEDVWGCFDSEENGTERFIYANNNFHKNGITNRLKEYFTVASEKAKQEGEDVVFFISTVNAVKDLSTFEPEWPEKTSAEYWRKKYNSTPYRSFMREYMNTHIQDGAIFKHKDILYGKMLPLDKYDALCFYGDLSYKDAGDYKALILVGKTKREYHIIHTYVSKGSRAKAAEWLYNLYLKKRLERFNIRYLIEGLFAMDEFVNDFDLVGDQYGFYIPVVADKRGKANKFDRIESMAGHFERKNVIFNEAERSYPDQVTLTDQLLAFEKGSKANDDGPDCLHGGISEVNKATFVEKFIPVVVSRKDMFSRSKNRY
jgi:predicted phage terminase large subunit-like protein